MAVDRTMNVLIVDDHQAMLDVLRKFLEQLEFTNVREAGDGAAALELLRADDFGLIISDWDMEPMTGIQLLREVRADSRLRHIPFIMATAECKAENVAAAREAGVSGYLLKPFDAATLKSRLTSVLGPF